MDNKTNITNIKLTTQKQISKQLGFSDSTFKRFRDDIQMDSRYNKNKHRKKKKNSNTSISRIQTQTTSENIKNTKNRRTIWKVVLF